MTILGREAYPGEQRRLADRGHLSARSAPVRPDFDLTGKGPHRCNSASATTAMVAQEICAQGENSGRVECFVGSSWGLPRPHETAVVADLITRPTRSLLRASPIPCTGRAGRTYSIPGRAPLATPPRHVAGRGSLGAGG